MRKIFTIFATLLVALMVNAETRTLYCKVDKSWWTDGSAGVNCYAKEEGVSEMSAWPGDAMTSLGDGLWSIEIDAKYNKVNFTRVNPDQDTYWGAKTDELNIPNFQNLYTITSDDAQWDSEGHMAAGAWSISEDIKFFIAGSMTNWENNPISSTNNSYTLNLTAGKHQLKVVDRSENWLGMSALTDTTGGLYQDASGAICFQLAAAGEVVVTFSKPSETITTFTVTGAFSAPSVAFASELNSWSPTADVFTIAPDQKTASWSYTPIALPTEDYQYGFQIVFDGDQWIAVDGYWVTREHHTVSGLSATGEGKNLIFRPDVVNKSYLFTWTYAKGELDVTFPDKGSGTAIDYTEAATKAVKRIVNGQLVIKREGKLFNALGAEVK